MARPSRNQQVSMQKKLRTYYERNQSASYAACQTGINIKTVCNYFRKWSEEINKACELDFIARQRQDREQILLSYDIHLDELYDLSDILNSEIKKHKEVPKHLISQKIQAISMISSITEKKGAFQLQVPPDESLRKTLSEMKA